MTMMVNTMHQAHPMASIFRPMNDEHLKWLAAEIKVLGQINPIRLLGDLIVDGRSRERACRMAGVPPFYRPWTGTEEELFHYVIAENIGRRDLTIESKALAGARVSNVGTGFQPETWKPPAGSLTTFPVNSTRIEQLFGVHRTSMQKAKAVLRNGTEEVIVALDNAKLSISTAFNMSSERKPPTTRVERTKTRDNSNVYAHLKLALTELTSLPKAADVAAIARTLDRSGLTTKKLPVALAWLQEFTTCLSSKS